MIRDPVVSASRVVRAVLGTATVALVVLAFAVDREPRLFAAAAMGMSSVTVVTNALRLKKFRADI